MPACVKWGPEWIRKVLPVKGEPMPPIMINGDREESDREISGNNDTQEDYYPYKEVRR